jgi:hypothetical protein
MSAVAVDRPVPLTACMVGVVVTVTGALAVILIVRVDDYDDRENASAPVDPLTANAAGMSALWWARFLHWSGL